MKKLDGNQIEGRFGKAGRFVLNAKPFRLDLFTNDIFVMSVNSKNMFNFEHYRKKPEGETTDTNVSSSARKFENIRVFLYRMKIMKMECGKKHSNLIRIQNPMVRRMSYS